MSEQSGQMPKMPKQSGCQIPTDSDELAKHSNPGQMLTISGQMTKQSGKVPNKSSQIMPTQSAGQMVEKHSGKAPNDASYSWLENHWQKMFGKEYHGQLNKFIEGINKKQSAVGSKKSARLNALKQSLAYAVVFMAKRGKIPMESPRGETEKKPKAILIELIDIYNELQLDIEKGTENCQKSDQKGKGKNGQKGKKENGQKEQHFLRFVARSLEIKWDANAFLGGPEEDEDDSNFRAIFGRMSRASRARAANVVGTMPSQNAVVVVGVVATAPQIQLTNAEDIKVITSTAYDGTEEIECKICLEEIKKMGKQKEEEVITLECNHIFHYECIDLWFKNGHNTCPCCRHAHPNTRLLNGATKRRGETAQGNAAGANPQEWAIDVPSADGQNGGNTVGTDGAETNRRNNGTANGRK
ncbi:hypothetical protein niasHT_033104 [Heterodera trifolii]|uniref:RING-type domain-containing protein n=1 Tax=Heterodera trifolii TaxID=157864 RepID=A0ABD2IDB6_9BILA